MLDVCCSRRGLIRGTLATAATAAIAWPAGTAEAEAAERTAPTLGYMSRPDLKPPRIKMSHRQPLPASPQYFLITADGPVGHKGPLILDQNGDVIWFSPVPPAGEATNFNAQTYRGAPVLTWWERTRPSNDPTFGVGVGYIANQQYKVIAKVSAGNGLTTDFHELNLTSHGTALITARRSHQVNLSKLGGPAKGYVWSGVAQEINVATGKVVFEWDSMNHVPVTETLRGFTGGGQVNPFDYFHINSVAEMDDGNLLISGRNTWTLYKVDRSSGKIIWRLNGKRSNFSLSSAAKFYWQHHARQNGANGLTVFDNAGPKKERQSRGLSLSVDTSAMHVDLTQAYIHPARFLSNTLGSVQVLDDGRVFVGWGDQPYFSEFAPDGTLLLTGQLPIGVRSYRTFAANWVGQPAEPPQVVAKANPASGFVVWASWNGATEIDSWTVLAGPDKTSLTPVGSQPWGGFETPIAVNSTGPYFAVVAVDRSGKELGRSAVV